MSDRLEPKMTDVTSRVSLELTHEQTIRIEQIMADGRFSDHRDLFNNAVTLLTWVMRHAKSGHSIVALDDEGENCYELSMPFLTGMSDMR